MKIKLLEASPVAHHRDFQIIFDDMPPVIVEVSDRYLPHTDPLTENIAMDIAQWVRTSPDILKGFRRFQAGNDMGQYPNEPRIIRLKAPQQRG